MCCMIKKKFLCGCVLNIISKLCEDSINVAVCDTVMIDPETYPLRCNSCRQKSISAWYALRSRSAIPPKPNASVETHTIINLIGGTNHSSAWKTEMLAQQPTKKQQAVKPKQKQQETEKSKQVTEDRREKIDAERKWQMKIRREKERIEQETRIQVQNDEELEAMMHADFENDRGSLFGEKHGERGVLREHQV